MLTLFGFSIHLYGITAALGIFAGTSVASHVFKKFGYDQDLIWDGLIWVIVGGILGARIYHVVDLWSYYANNLGDILAVWKGGLGIFGGLLGGGLGLWGFALRKKLNQKTQKALLDSVALGLPLGQAIGRWGNYFNQELYGPPATLPWAIYINPENRLPGYESISTYHPLFLYESLLNLSLFLILFGLISHKKIPFGQVKVLGLYLIGYSLIRFCLEFLRIEKWEIGAIPTAQIVSVCLLLLGVYIVGTKHVKKI